MFYGARRQLSVARAAQRRRTRQFINSAFKMTSQGPCPNTMLTTAFVRKQKLRKRTATFYLQLLVSRPRFEPQTP
jgi:hypothetical protein